jgi:hypothetical protein
MTKPIFFSFLHPKLGDTLKPKVNLKIGENAKNKFYEQRKILFYFI